MTTGFPRQAADADAPIYLDCNATTPLDPRVLEEVIRYLRDEYGNAGSRTHGYGLAAKLRVNQARQEVAALVEAEPDEVIFTSGATESNNLALLGLATFGEQSGKRHIISTAIEHKAVLEPLERLAQRGFDVTLIPPTTGGWVDPALVTEALRPDTLAVSVMAANNETGVIQPVEAIAEALSEQEVFLHVDAAQTFGKLRAPLLNQRIDMISVSGHKLYAPKGIGALIVRRRGYNRVPIEPLAYGGGQERGLRPGTLPVPLIAGLGMASRLAYNEGSQWAKQCTMFKKVLMDHLQGLPIEINGDTTRTLPSVVNISVQGVDSEAAILATKDLVSISNGSACTSHKYEPSHVLKAMSLAEPRARGAVRMSWCHMTPAVEWPAVVARWRGLT